VLDHWDDLVADFLRFYRIGPGCPLQMEDLDGPTLFALAHRVSAYGGVMSARLADQQHAPASTGEVCRLPSDRAVLAGELGDLFEVSHA